MAGIRPRLIPVSAARRGNTTSIWGHVQAVPIFSGEAMSDWIGYLMLAAIAALSVAFIWLLIIGICIIADALGVY